MTIGPTEIAERRAALIGSFPVLESVGSPSPDQLDPKVRREVGDCIFDPLMFPWAGLDV